MSCTADDSGTHGRCSRVFPGHEQINLSLITNEWLNGWSGACNGTAASCAINDPLGSVNVDVDLEAHGMTLAAVGSMNPGVSVTTTFTVTNTSTHPRSGLRIPVKTLCFNVPSWCTSPPASTTVGVVDQTPPNGALGGFTVNGVDLASGEYVVIAVTTPWAYQCVQATLATPWSSGLISRGIKAENGQLGTC